MQPPPQPELQGTVTATIEPVATKATMSSSSRPSSATTTGERGNHPSTPSSWSLSALFQPSSAAPTEAEIRTMRNRLEEFQSKVAAISGVNAHLNEQLSAAHSRLKAAEEKLAQAEAAAATAASTADMKAAAVSDRDANEAVAAAAEAAAEEARRALDAKEEELTAAREEAEALSLRLEATQRELEEEKDAAARNAAAAAGAIAAAAAESAKLGADRVAAAEAAVAATAEEERRKLEEQLSVARARAAAAEAEASEAKAAAAAAAAATTPPAAPPPTADPEQLSRLEHLVEARDKELSLLRSETSRLKEATAASAGITQELSAARASLSASEAQREELSMLLEDTKRQLEAARASAAGVGGLVAAAKSESAAELAAAKDAAAAAATAAASAAAKHAAELAAARSEAAAAGALSRQADVALARAEASAAARDLEEAREAAREAGVALASAVRERDALASEVAALRADLSAAAEAAAAASAANAKRPRSPSNRAEGEGEQSRPDLDTLARSLAAEAAAAELERKVRDLEKKLEAANRASTSGLGALRARSAAAAAARDAALCDLEAALAREAGVVAERDAARAEACELRATVACFEAKGENGKSDESAAAFLAPPAPPSSAAPPSLSASAVVVGPPLAPPLTATLPPHLQGAPWDALRAEGAAAGWLLDPSEVTLGPLVATGTSGPTSLGLWRGARVAVKRVSGSLRDARSAGAFLREVRLLAGCASLRHPNVLQFVAASLVPPEGCWILTEFMEGGTLSDWLHSKTTNRSNDATSTSTSSTSLLLLNPCSTPLSLPDRRSLSARLRMALGVAQGMCAFEQARPHPLLHRDLKPSNVLLDASGRPRVADVGLARALAPGEAPGLTGETGTYLYMAPEIFNNQVYNSRADVWSFGVMMCELVSGRRPYEEHLLTPAQVAMEVSAGRLRPALPPSAPPAAAALAAACLEVEPSLRPPFASLVPALSRLVAEAEAAEAKAASEVEGASGLLNKFWGGGGGGGV